MRLRLLPFLLALLAVATFEPHVRAQTPAAAPDLKQNITNLASLDFPVRMQAARLIRRTAETQAVPALEQAALTHRAVDSVLEAKMFPTMQAIANVYQEALRQDKEDAAKVNPIELWDLHHLRRLDDAGFIDSLYGNQRPSH